MTHCSVVTVLASVGLTTLWPLCYLEKIYSSDHQESVSMTPSPMAFRRLDQSQMFIMVNVGFPCF